jgi:uncharacterized membrane protein YecN with MAPEG domain
MDISVSAHAAALWTALILLLGLVLSLQVVRQRTKHKVLIGDDGVPELVRAVRAFGNMTEYSGLGLGGLIMLTVVGASPLAVHLFGAVFLIGRVAHAIGISQSTGSSLGRAAGTLLTWLAFVFAIVVLLFNAF